MKVVDRFTPKDVEEIKPNFFIEKTSKGYKRVYPLAWNGKWRTKENLKSIFSFRTLFTISLVLFLAWSYKHDNESLLNFYNLVHKNPIDFCEKVMISLKAPSCSPEFEKLGLCFNNFGADFSSIELFNESSNSLS